MNSRSLSNIAVVALAVLGAAFIALRYHARREADIARQDSRWELTYEIAFKANPSPTGDTAGTAGVDVAMPFDTPYCKVTSEEWTNAGLKAKRVKFTPSGTTELQLTTTQPGDYSPQVDFELRLSPRADASRDPGLQSLSRDDRDRYLGDDDGIFPIRDIAETPEFRTLSQSGATEWEQIVNVFDECMSIRIDPEAVSGVTSALANDRTDSPAMRARTMVTLLRALGIPSRLVTGFVIGQTSNAVPLVWVEVFYHQRWVPFDTESGYSQTLPSNYVPVRRGGDAIVQSVGDVTIPPAPDGPRYSISALPPDPRVAKAETPHPLQILNLERLPVPMHTVLKILLLLPLAALITAVMRNVIGLGTFGTFSPALLAMSFIYADWKIGLLILIIVVSIGLFGRSILERLRLLMVPRLSIVLTMVILCVVFTLSTLYYMFPQIQAQAVLLPMVIMTMLIERFHVTVEEDGFVYAAKLSLGTLLVAMLCFAVLRWPTMGNVVLVYPEAHLFTIALFILLGRYAGYRLTELWRFRDLVESGEPAR
jgi:hypothetical protein